MSTIQIFQHSVKSNTEEMLLNRILAHEMKNNLDLIQLGIRDLKIGNSTDTHQTLKILESATENMTGLFEVFKCGFIPPQFRQTLLNELILSQISMLESTAQQSKIQLNFKFYSENIIINSDQSALGSCFFNLMQNAMEACESNDSITVEAWSVSSSAHVKITDTGKGMDSQTLHNMWKHFFTTKENKSNSHGLGTYIARTTILNHKGSIYAESRLNSGTTIHISLPLYRSSFAA